MQEEKKCLEKVFAKGREPAKRSEINQKSKNESKALKKSFRC